MRHKGIKGVLVGALVVLNGLLAPPAWSVHDTNTFELDGNVLDAPATLGDDWSTVNFNGGSSNILARTNVKADAAPASIFSGGGSKDDLDLNGPLSGAGGWKWKNGSVPDKDDITNAYAVAYNVNGDLVIYAGADRFDNSGDAFIGFWFFQDQVGTSGATSGGFTGQHRDGDVLVLANFTGGGTTVNIEILEWVGSGGNVNGTLQRIAGGPGGSQATCGTSANDNYCGIANVTGGETPNWTYLSKDNTSSFPAATFFEVGINISKVFAAAGAGTTPCFSSFMAETRSSSSVSAVLKDFVLDSFPVCGIEVTKQCINPVLASSTTVGYTIEGMVKNTGFGTLTNLTLSDEPRPLGTTTYHACTAGGLPTGSAISFGGSLNALASVCYRSSIVTPVNGEDDTITATASTGSATVSDTATADCPNLQLSPAIDVTKLCSATLTQLSGHLAVRINVEGTVCNIGDTALTNVNVVDNTISGNLVTNASLAIGACRNYTGFYLPATAQNKDSPLQTTLDPGLAKFTDTVTATGLAPFGFSVQPDTATAECTLCPGGICPSPTPTSSTLLRSTTR